jgi:hypothetical protein
MTFPGTSATIARTDAAQTFTGTQTFTTIQGASALTINTGASVSGQRNINITGGNNSQTGGSTSGSNVILTGGNLTGAATSGSVAGEIYIIGGNATNGFGGGLFLTTGTGSNGQGSVSINASGGSLTAPAAGGVSILATTTAIEGTVKLTSLGTSGFVKLSTGGTLVQDTNTYLTSASASSAGFTKKYAENNGALTATSGAVTWTVTHNLNTSNVIVETYQNSTNASVEVDVVTTNANVVTLTFNSATLAGSEYRAVVIG